MGLFGIGTYQSLSGGTVYGTGFPTTGFSLSIPGSGVYGGTYGYLVDTRIRAPSFVSYQPATEIGLDGNGISVVRGFPTLTWSYTTLRPDYWYQLILLYRQSGRTPVGFQRQVLLQYPDPLYNGIQTQILARMDPPIHDNRDVGAYHGVQLKFTYLGQAMLLPTVPIVQVS